MRCVLLLPMLLSFACASGGEDLTMNTPNWNGPAVSASHKDDGSLHIEMMAPTAGHSFSLLDVERSGSRADVRMQHRKPTGDFVAQVLTPLPVELAASELDGMKSVFVWVVHEDEPAKLALATARP